MVIVKFLVVKMVCGSGWAVAADWQAQVAVAGTKTQINAEDTKANIFIFYFFIKLFDI
jgi:hypothetical protein